MNWYWATSNILGILLTVMPLSALAGGSHGGGGSGILCLKPNGQPKPAEITDLIEAVFYDKRHITLSKLPWRKQVEQAVTRLGVFDPEFNTLLRKTTNDIVKALGPALEETKGTRLVFPSPADLGSGRIPPVPVDCRIVGVIVYSDDDNNKLSASSFVWNALPETHKAALIVHEAIYKIQRSQWQPQPQTSADVRRLVGLAFSDEFAWRSAQMLKFARASFRDDQVYRGYGLPFRPDWEGDFTELENQGRIRELAEPFISFSNGLDNNYFENLTPDDRFQLTVIWPKPGCTVDVGVPEPLLHTVVVASEDRHAVKVQSDDRGMAEFLHPASSPLSFHVATTCPDREGRLVRLKNGVPAGDTQYVQVPLLVKAKQDYANDFLKDFVLDP